VLTILFFRTQQNEQKNREVCDRADRSEGRILSTEIDRSVRIIPDPINARHFYAIKPRRQRAEAADKVREEITGEAVGAMRNICGVVTAALLCVNQ